MSLWFVERNSVLRGMDECEKFLSYPRLLA